MPEAMRNTFHPSTGFLIRLIAFILLFAFFTSPGFAMPSHVLLIRHAEKPDNQEGRELSEQGWLRARSLPNIFTRSPLKELGPPQVLIGMSPDRKKGSIRSLQTLKYLSAQFNLPIVDDFTRDQAEELIQEIETNPLYDQKFIVICWQHDGLRDLGKLMGWKKAPKWPSEQFDRNWLLDFDVNGSLRKVQDLPQLLLPGDSR
jgi:hypothetical protein